jgi:hypothetical protein
VRRAIQITMVVGIPLTLVLLGVAVFGSRPGGLAGRSGGVALTPAHVADSVDLVNPMRGFHQWRDSTGAATIPNPAPYPLDGYDRYWWSDLEPTEGNYDFSELIDDLRDFADPARNGGVSGRRFGFRIRAMSNGTDGSLRVPAYLRDCTTYFEPNDVNVPKWNEACFQDSLPPLLSALDAALQPYRHMVGFVDIGIYGQWGEWAMPGYPPRYRATDDTLKFIIDQHVEHLGWAQLLLFIGADDGSMHHAMSMDPETTPGLSRFIGLRSDCYDTPGYLTEEDRLDEGQPPILLDRWKIAPIVVERCNNPDANGQTALDMVVTYHISSIGNHIIAANRSDEQFELYAQAGRAAGYRLTLPEVRIEGRDAQPTVQLDWLNTGSAPPYDAWDVMVTFESGGVVRASASGPLPYVDLLPGETHTQQLAASTTEPLRAGEYTVRIKLTDPDGYLQPMQLPLADGDARDGYVLGTVTL